MVNGNKDEEDSEARKAKCLKRHVLSVQLTVGVTSCVTVTLTFQWLVTLEVVTVMASVAGVTVADAGIAFSDLLASSSLLSAMYPGDTGETCPNLSSVFHLKRAGVDEFPSQMEGLGVPYRWAQTLCGLGFLNEQPTGPGPSAHLSQLNMESTLKVIRGRLRSRIALAKEIKLLESGEALQGKKLQASVTWFRAATLADLHKVDSAAVLLQQNIIDGSYLVYRAELDVHGVKLSAHIVVPPTYPSVLPIILLEVLQKPNLTSINNDHIRDIEREINAQPHTQSDGDVLLQKVYNLLLCSEMLIATEMTTERPVTATYFRAVMGRRRSHPFRYMNTAGGIFTHR